jgi:hypothetical protein
METMAWAYVFAWAAVIAYVTWLAVQNGRLGRRLEELERSIQSGLGENRSSSRAA